jgi:hypothetical protein
MAVNESKTNDILYIFKFLDGTSRHVEIRLDKKSMDLVPPDGELPEWTRFNFHTCEGCTLQEKGGNHCPVAVNISGVIGYFSDLSPNEATHVMIMTKNRDYSKSVTLQDGLSALLGLCMAASPCPVLGKLKPLVRYHLPFATLNESVFRVASMYLLVQHFLWRKGKKPDWELKGLTSIYEKIHLVNSGMTKRLMLAAQQDSSLKAIASLDHTASLVPFVINETLDDIEASLSSYMED